MAADLSRIGSRHSDAAKRCRATAGPGILIRLGTWREAAVQLLNKGRCQSATSLGVGRPHFPRWQRPSFEYDEEISRLSQQGKWTSLVHQ